MRYIEGYYFLFQAPPNSGSTFYNYKGNHSINLMAISDSKYRFIIVDIGASGRHNDSGVFTNSGLASAFERNGLKLPAATPLINSDKQFPFVMVADEAFPLTMYMMRPYPRARNLNIRKKIFNYRLSRARRVIESAFGILVARWRIFRKPIIATIRTAIRIVKATTVLHNFIINSEAQLPPR